MIKVALTCDVERDYSIKNVMPKVHQILKKYDAVGTWFIQHDLGKHHTKYCGVVDDVFPDIVEKLSDVGEIGCHVHFREKTGRFSSKREFQERLIEEATDSLRDKGYEVNSFRGGDHFFTKETLNILEDLNYKIDSSIMQGFYRKLQDDLQINFVINRKIKHFNLPYHMDENNFLEIGNSKLLEIPVTNILQFQRKPNHFLPFPVPGHAKLGFFSECGFLLLKTCNFLYNTSFINILFHDFTFNSKNSLKYFENFVRNCSNDPSVNFVTLSDFSKSL